MALSIFKLFAGLLGRSSAMVADAVHSLSDFVSDIVVLVLVRLSAKGQDKDHDYGHGKFETLASAIVSLLLLGVGVKLMIDGIAKIRFLAGGGVLESPAKIALWAALASIAVKEFLYQWTARVGRKENSSAVVANAWHHRSDALSSVGSALGIGGAILFGGEWVALDPITGCVISVVIVIASVKMLLPAFRELTEASLPDETEDRIMAMIQSVPGVENAHALKTRKVGPYIIVEAHIVVDPDMNVARAHSIATEVENGIRKEFGRDTQVIIHTEPAIDSE